MVTRIAQQTGLAPDSIRRRHAWMFYAVVAIIAVMLGVVGWALMDNRRASRDAAQQAEAAMTLTLDQEILRIVDEVDLALRAAVKGMATPGLADMDPAVRQAVLFDGAIAAQAFGGVFICDRNGMIVYNSLGLDRSNVNISQRPFFAQHRDHPELGLTISGPLISRSDGQWTLAIARRISGADGAFAGIAVAALRLGYFQSLFSTIDIGQHGVVELASTDRRLVVRRPFVEHDVGRPTNNAALVALLAQHPTGSFESARGGGGVNRVFSYRQVGVLPLIVEVGLSTREIDAEWTGKTIIVGSVLVALSVLGLALARLLQGRIVAEHAALVAAALAERTADVLAHALAPLDALFRNSTDIMLAARMNASGDFVYEAVNPVWEEAVGIPAGSAIGRSPAECLPPALAAAIMPKWRECVAQRRAVRFEFMTERHSDEREWEDLVAPVFGADGKISQLIVVGREITERTRLQAALHQAQKMEVVGRLAAGISHDFNNILQVISGATDMIRQEALSPQGRNFLEMAERAARRGGYLTNHLLSYSRKQALNPKPLDLHELLDNLSSMLSRTLGTHILLTIDVAPSVGRVCADRALLETALVNLAINASHAMPHGGTLHVGVTSAPAKPFGPLTPGAYVVIAVSDTGTGMTPQVLDCIFDPFFTTKGNEGTGLGLAMVQGFSRQSGGEIIAASTPGKGSRFEIWLPEISAMPALHDVPAREPGDIGEGRILLVDDAQDVLVTISAFLRDGGCTVRQVCDGRQALAALAGGERFDVLVTDYMMPDLNGVALIKQARLIQPGLPALVISGFSDVTDFMADLPDAALLHKPFQRIELITQVSALMSRSTANVTPP
jgi:PAS domain S-box-containing protein